MKFSLKMFPYAAPMMWSIKERKKEKMNDVKDELKPKSVGTIYEMIL